MKVIVDGNEIDIPHKRIRLDALFEKAGLDPLKDQLALVDSKEGITVLCCLHVDIEIAEGMCFVTCL